ncbi:MAG: hypothetical protein H8E10_08465 [Desulfobacterales bacterium]|nr:hypothetical protein [Desulfobacterales bacterium]MBL7205587.1 hypothetical protein [Desulfobacteraceae bacterium]
MKKLLTAIAAAVFLVCPSLCFSSYIIHLKDGREFATDRYYEEGDQIKFKRYGGVIGIQKDLVREIEVIEEAEDIPEKEEAAKPETPVKTDVPAAEGETGKQRASKDAAKGEATKQNGADGQEKGKEKDQVKEQKTAEEGAEEGKKNLIDKYTKEFNLINEKFKDVQMMTKEDLYKLVDELSTFRKGVLSNRLAGIFSKHLVEIYSMLDAIEASLKFRGD